MFVVPAPTGTSRVGTRAIELVDRSRREPGSNGRQPRSFVMQLWYPRAPGKGQREPYMPRKIAAYLGGEAGLPPSIFTSVKLAAISNAPAAPPRRRLAGRALLDRLRRRAAAVQRPHSRTSPVTATWWSRWIIRTTRASSRSLTATRSRSARSATTRTRSGRALAVRIADTRYVLGALVTSRRQPLTAGSSDVLDLDRIGMFGHSLGGATAAAAMLIDRRIDAGLDMDGSLFGKVAHDRARPAVHALFRRPGFPGDTPEPCPSSGAHLRASRYALDFAGAAHFAFSRPRVSPAPVGRHP